MQENNVQQENDFKYLYQIPFKNERHISIGIQTTGLSTDSNIIELGSYEIINGKVTNNFFQIHIPPRYYMNTDVNNIIKKNNDFYDYIKDISSS